jgi:hypothetical protein
LCPYLSDMDVNDLDYPLAQFTARKSDKEGTLQLLTGINEAIRASKQSALARSDEDLKDVFEALWHQFAEKLKDKPDDSSPVPKKAQGQLIEECWEMLRSLSQSVSDLQKPIAPIY